MDEFEVIDKLKGLASSESAGVTDEVQSAWQQWDLVRGEASGDPIERKRSAQLSLAGMDFKRQRPYVLSVSLPHVEGLSSVHRKPSLEYTPVCPSLARAGFTSPDSLSQIGTDEMMSMAHGWGSYENLPLKISTYSDKQLSNINFLLGGGGDGTRDTLCSKPVS